MTDKTCMSYWFPKIEVAGINVPRTIFATLPSEAQIDLFNYFDGKEPVGLADPFFARLTAAAEQIGRPCFLRSGHTSAKHDWDRTCRLDVGDDIRAHVMAIIEYGEMSSLMGLPIDVWCVREMLSTIPVGTCPGYGNMPVCREFRIFAADGEILCHHPYWPMYALEQGDFKPNDLAFDYGEFCTTPDMPELLKMARNASNVCGGAWSVDMLETKRGWFLTDMAEAEKSFHWHGCKNAS